MKKITLTNVLIGLMIAFWVFPAIIDSLGYKIDYNHILAKQDLPSHEEKNYKVYLTKDNKLVYIDPKIALKIKLEVNNLDESEKNIIKGMLIDQYIQLLTYMSVDNYRHNESAQKLAIGILHNQIMHDDIIMLSKTYQEIAIEDKYKDKIKELSLEDITLLRKGNIYSINAPDRVINPIIELEKIICSEENKKIDMRAERHFLESLEAK